MVKGLDSVKDAVVSHGTSGSSSSGSRDPTPSVEKPEQGQVDLLFDLLADDDANEDITIHAFASDAKDDGREIPEGVVEAYDLPEGCETWSWEDLLGLDLSDYKYVGYPPRDRNDDGVTYEEGWDSSDFTGDLTGETKDILNGHFAQEIQDRFNGPDADADSPTVALAIRVPPKSQYDGDFEEQHKYQRFYIQDAPTSGKTVLQARNRVGELSDSEYEELMQEHPAYQQSDAGNWVTADD